MMPVEYSKKANDQLEKLPDDLGARIEEKIQWYADQDNPLLFAKPLHGFRETLYRFRVGDYRSIFKIEKGKVSILFVLAIQHRKEAYR